MHIHSNNKRALISLGIALIPAALLLLGTMVYGYHAYFPQDLRQQTLNLWLPVVNGGGSSHGGGGSNRDNNECQGDYGLHRCSSSAIRVDPISLATTATTSVTTANKSSNSPQHPDSPTSTSQQPSYFLSILVIIASLATGSVLLLRRTKVVAEWKRNNP